MDDAATIWSADLTQRQDLGLSLHESMNALMSVADQSMDTALERRSRQLREPSLDLIGAGRGRPACQALIVGVLYQAAEIVTLGTLSMRNGGRDGDRGGRRLYHLACVPHALARAAAPSATPDERVSEPSTARPLRFSISAWPSRTRQAFDQSWLDRPLPLRSSLASSSVVEAWGSFERVSPPANPSAEIPFAIPAGTRWLARSVLGPKAPHRRSRGSHAADASKAPGPPDRHR